MLFRFICIFSLFIGSLFSKEHTLNELIDIALENNTNITISKLKAQQQEAKVGVAQSDYLPNLSATGELAKYDLDNATVNDDGDVESVTITASQLIYDFGKTLGSIAASKEEFEASMNDVISVSSDTVLDVKTAYYNFLNQYRLIDVAKESLKIDQLQLEQASEYFKAGVKTKIDVTNAQLQLSNSKLNLLKAQYDLKTARSKFITILGSKEIQNGFEVKKENQSINNLAKSVKEKQLNLQQLTENALNNRAEMMVKEALVKAQQEKYRSSKGDYYPSLSLQGNYKNSDAEDTLSTLETEEYSAGLYLQWDFFSGFKTISNTKAQLKQLQSSKEELKQQELSIIEEVTVAFYNVQESIDSIAIAILSVNLAQQNLELAQERYKNGLNDIVELNDAKLEFIKSRNDLVNSFYDYKISMAQLDFSTGVIYKR